MAESLISKRQFNVRDVSLQSRRDGVLRQAIPHVVGFGFRSHFVYRNRRRHDGRYSTSADQRSSLTTWPLLQQFFTQRRVPSFGRQSLERHVDRHSICTETGALRSKTTHHLGTRPQAPNARRFALLFPFTGHWLAICTNERARPSLPSGRGGLSSSGCVSVSRQSLMSELGLSHTEGIEDFS